MFSLNQQCPLGQYRSRSCPYQETMNILLTILSSLLAVVAAVAQPEGALPAYMLGRYVLQTSEGFSDFMYRIDIGWFQRAVSGQNIIIHIFPHFLPR